LGTEKVGNQKHSPTGWFDLFNKKKKNKSKIQKKGRTARKTQDGRGGKWGNPEEGQRGGGVQKGTKKTKPGHASKGHIPETDGAPKKRGAKKKNGGENQALGATKEGRKTERTVGKKRTKH